MDARNEIVHDCVLLAIAPHKCAIVFRDIDTDKLTYVGKYHMVVDFGAGRVRLDRVAFALEPIVERLNALGLRFADLKVLRARATTVEVLPDAFRDACKHMRSLRKLEVLDDPDRAHEQSEFAVDNARTLELSDAEVVAVLGLPTESHADFVRSATAKVQKQFNRAASVDAGARELLKDSDIAVEATMTRTPPFVWKKTVVVRVGNVTKYFSSYKKAFEHFSLTSEVARAKRKFDSGAAGAGDASETASLAGGNDHRTANADELDGATAAAAPRTGIAAEAIAQLDAVAAAVAAAAVPTPPPSAGAATLAVPMVVSAPVHGVVGGNDALEAMGRLHKDAKMFVVAHDLFSGVDAESMNALRIAHEENAEVLGTLERVLDMFPPEKRTKIFGGVVKALVL